MTIRDSDKTPWEVRYDMRLMETKKRGKCGGCPHLPPKLDDSWSEPDRRCDKDYLIGRKNCPVFKSRGGVR